jgi:hypothetical protein
MKITTTITNTDSDEFRVRLFIDGVYQAGADYFTNDKKDAESTADAMKKKAVPSDKKDENAIREQKEYNREIQFNYWLCQKNNECYVCKTTIYQMMPINAIRQITEEEYEELSK